MRTLTERVVSTRHHICIKKNDKKKQRTATCHSTTQCTLLCLGRVLCLGVSFIHLLMKGREKETRCASGIASSWHCWQNEERGSEKKKEQQREKHKKLATVSWSVFFSVFRSRPAAVFLSFPSPFFLAFFWNPFYRSLRHKEKSLPEAPRTQGDTIRAGRANLLLS